MDEVGNPIDSVDNSQENKIFYSSSAQLRSTETQVSVRIITAQPKATAPENLRIRAGSPEVILKIDNTAATNVITKQPKFADSPSRSSAKSIYVSRDVGMLSKYRCLTIEEQRTWKERVLGDGIPCGFWGCCCGPPKKRYFAVLPENCKTRVYNITEESDACSRHCYPRFRNFTIRVSDYETEQEMFRIKRETAWVSCVATSLCRFGFFGFFPKSFVQYFSLRIEDSNHTPLGFVDQRSSCCSIEFAIRKRNREPLYYIRHYCNDGCVTNPCCIYPCSLPNICRCICGCKDVEAKIVDLAGNKVGSISWQYPKAFNACVMLKHKLFIVFPSTANPDARATIIGVALHLENFFEPYNNIFC